MRYLHRTLLTLSVVVLSAVVCHYESTARTQIASRPQELAKVARDGQAATSPGDKIVIATGSKIVLLNRAVKAVLWESAGLYEAYCVAAMPGGGFVVGAGKSLAQIDENGKVVSRVSANLRSTTDVKMLENGRMLVSDGKAGTVVEMDWSGKVTWTISNLHHPSEAIRLENGDTLVADGTARLKQFNSDGKLVGTTKSDHITIGTGSYFLVSHFVTKQILIPKVRTACARNYDT